MYNDKKSFFLYIRKWESGTLQIWWKVCNVADLPPGKICNERGKICNVANLPPWGKVCNVADLPGEGLQCCRSSGGKVCSVADLPGGKSARGKVCNTTVAHIVCGRFSIHILLAHIVCQKFRAHSCRTLFWHTMCATSWQRTVVAHCSGTECAPQVYSAQLSRTALAHDMRNPPPRPTPPPG